MLCAFKCPTTSFNGNPPSTGPRRSSPPPNINPQLRCEPPEPCSRTISPLNTEAAAAPRPRAFPAPQRRRLRRDTWLSAPGAPGRPRPPALPHPSVQWLRRRGRQPARGGRSAAKHTPAGAEHRPSPPAGRGTAPRASPPTPAPPATTAPSPPPPLAIRAGHRAAEAPPPGAPQTKPSRGSTWGEEEVAARPRPTLRQPRPTCSPLPLGIHFPEKPVSPRAALPQAPSTMSRSSPPGPGGPRSFTSPWSWGRGILSDGVGWRGTRARCSLCPARVELL